MNISRNEWPKQIAFKLFVTFLLCATIVLSIPHEGVAQSELTKQYEAIQALNYIIVSLSRIINYNDAGVLQQEYDNILNNINLNHIPDKDIIELLASLMNNITEQEISDEQREEIEGQYLINVDNSLTQSAITVVSGIRPLLNLYASLASAVMKVGSVYFNYTAQIDNYKEQRKKEEWQLEANLKKNLNDTRTKLLRYSWELLNKYKIPDEWRLSEENVAEFLSTLKDFDKDKDAARLLRRLKRQNKYFSMYPPYWYYRGKAAQGAKQNKEALDCYNQFFSIRQPVMRMDPYAVAVAMNRISLEEDSNTKIDSDLEMIKNNSRSTDWNNYLFLALQWARLGDTKQSSEMISTCLDNGHKEILRSAAVLRLAAETVLVSSDPKVVNKAIEAIRESEEIKLSDIVHLYGQMRKKDILRVLEPELEVCGILATPIQTWNPYKLVASNDDLTVFLPKRWFLEDQKVRLSLISETSGSKLIPSKVFTKYSRPPIDKEPPTIERDEKSRGQQAETIKDIEEGKKKAGAVALVFEDVISIKDIVKSKEAFTAHLFVRPEKLPYDRKSGQYYQVELIFSSQVISRQEEKTWWTSARGWLSKFTVAKYLLPKDDVDMWTVGFRPAAVVLDGDVYQWDQQGLRL
jgi:hypothetical protein